MKVKRIVLSIMTVAILLSQLSGCSVTSADELADMIADGENITIEVTLPSWSKLDEVDIIDKSWISLDQLTTYQEFREDFDKLFNINTVTTSVGNTKQGSIYTISYQGKDVQCGNSTMRDAFRNKAFDKYFNDESVRTNLSSFADKAYTDVESTDSVAITSTLNAYFNLLSESENDPTYEATLSLTRDEFYTLVCKAGTQVGTITPATSDFKATVINSTHSDYNYAMASKAWLSYEDGSLNSENISKPISKLEALYLIVNTYFPDKVKALEVTSKDTAYGFKDAGDLATTIGVNSDGASRSKSGNLLAYMLKNPKAGLSEDMFKVIKVAEGLDLLRNIKNKDLTQSITKDEAMQLLINTYESENKQYGYLTTTEYPEYEVVDNKVVHTYTSEQEAIFKQVKSEIDKTVDPNNPLSVLDGLSRGRDLIDGYISSGKLPEGSDEVYVDWLHDQTDVSSDATVPASSTATVPDSSDTTTKDTTSGNTATTTTPKSSSSTGKTSSSNSNTGKSQQTYSDEDLPEGMRPGFYDDGDDSNVSDILTDETGTPEQLEEQQRQWDEQARLHPIPPDTHFN